MRKKDVENYKQNTESCTSIASKIRSFIAGLTPAAVFRVSLLGSVIVLAAAIIYHTATQSIHVNINKVDTATVVLTGSDNLGDMGSIRALRTV